MPLRVLFLTPRLPPAVCGLADHTALLAEAMAAQGAGVAFVHCQPAGGGAAALPGAVHRWDGTAADLAAFLQAQAMDWLWVQLSAYGYSRWGAPYQLGRVLRAVRRRLPQVRLAVYLHETHCDAAQLGWKGPVLAPWQRYTVGRIVRLADAVFTSTAFWRERAVRCYRLPAERVVLLSIGSNLPAVEITPEQRRAERQARGWGATEMIGVIFGSFAMQQRALERFETLLRAGRTSGGLDRIVCLGGEQAVPPAELLRWHDRLPGPLDILGHRPAAEAATVLACCDYGFPGTPRCLLEKSGGFAAFAEAGLAVITDSAPFPAVADRLPVLAAAEWNWNGDGGQIMELRRQIAALAEECYCWRRIATLALAHLDR